MNQNQVSPPPSAKDERDDHQHLARRMFVALSSHQRVWLDPPCRRLLAQLNVPLPENTTGPTLDLLMLTCSHVTQDGIASLSPDTAAQLADRVATHTFAVITDQDIGTTLVSAPGPEPHRQVSRVFMPRSVLDVHAEGLVVVELAAGVSAADLQRSVTPTLRISSAVCGLNLAASATTDDAAGRV